MGRFEQGGTQAIFYFCAVVVAIWGRRRITVFHVFSFRVSQLRFLAKSVKEKLVKQMLGLLSSHVSPTPRARDIRALGLGVF